MIPVLVSTVSVFVFAAMFILLKALSQKPECDIIITPLSTIDIAELLASAGDAKGGSLYIVTTDYDEKYFRYLEKHYFIREVLTVVDRNN